MGLGGGGGGTETNSNQGGGTKGSSNPMNNTLGSGIMQQSAADYNTASPLPKYALKAPVNRDEASYAETVYRTIMNADGVVKEQYLTFLDELMIS